MDREQFILAAYDIVRAEAGRAVRSCRNSITFDDLVGEGVLLATEYADGFLSADNPLGFFRYIVRRELRRYIWRYEDVIRKPLTPGLNVRPSTLSLDVLVGDSESCTLGELVPADVDGDAILLAGLRQALEELPELQRRAVVERFNGNNVTKVRAYRVFCKELGLTEKAAMALVNDALTLLRRELVGEVA